MYFIPNECYHIYNRGNNKNKVFYNDENYLLFLNKLHYSIKPFCDILCWTLMPNHFHFLIHANEKSISPRIAGKIEIQELSYRIGILLSSYAQIINKQNGTIGSLFQQRTKAKDFTQSIDLRKDNSYLTNCMHYILKMPGKQV